MWLRIAIFSTECATQKPLLTPNTASTCRLPRRREAAIDPSIAYRQVRRKAAGLGAARNYVNDDQWQNVFAQDMSRAALVVLPVGEK